MTKFLIKGTFLSIIFIAIYIIAFAQDKIATLRIDLEINHLYVVRIEFLSKEYNGNCDCSISSWQKSNKCSLFKVEIDSLVYQADSSILKSKEILSTKHIIIGGNLQKGILAGQRYIAILGNTSSKDYLQLELILPYGIDTKFEFKQHAHLSSLLTCGRKRPTIKK